MRSPALITAGIAALLLAGGGWTHAWAQPSEYQVKAAYLAKFAPFVEWPPSAFKTPTAPVTICVAGADPFGSGLDRIASGQQLGPRPITVRRLSRPDRNSGCHILFASGSGSEVAEMLNAVRGAPVLTVTEGEGAPRGVINFVVRANRVRFEIDGQEAARNRLGLSSKLLSLAVSVRTRADR